MSTVVHVETQQPARSMWIWFAPVQAAVAFTILAIAAGGQVLRTWLLAALVWIMAMPLLVSLEAGLIAMMLFEPVRGVLRRAQYLFVDYSNSDPIHLLTPIVMLLAFILLLKNQRLDIFRQTRLAQPVSLLLLTCFILIFNPLHCVLLIALLGPMFF